MRVFFGSIVDFYIDLISYVTHPKEVVKDFKVKSIRL